MIPLIDLQVYTFFVPMNSAAKILSLQSLILNP